MKDLFLIESEENSKKSLDATLEIYLNKKNMIKAKSWPEWTAWIHSGEDQRPQIIYAKEKSGVEKKERKNFLMKDGKPEFYFL